MFVTKNEAGVGVAILLAGVLLVLGIQGTQLGKVGGKDIGFELMVREEERRLEIAERAEKVAEDRPAEAQAMLEGYQVADPGARSSPALAEATRYVYEQRVIQALSQFTSNLGFGLAGGGIEGDDTDAKLVYEGGVIAVEVMFRKAKALQSEDVRRVHRLLQRVDAQGLLFVTNVAVFDWTKQVVEELTPPVEVVRWNGDQDNANLINAMHRLRARIQGGRPPDHP